MIAALTSLSAPHASTLGVTHALAGPVHEAAGWLEQPPLALVCTIVLTGVLLMLRPVQSEPASTTSPS